jgi:hypothetical protein
MAGRQREKRRRAGPPASPAARHVEAAARALDALRARPAALVGVAWALHALVRPYLGLHHDARLYALLVADRMSPGRLGEDLFLRFGAAQDRYSLLPRLLAPLGAALGVEAAFFAVYVAADLAFWWGLGRLALRLFPGRAAVLGLLAAAVSGLPFGGLGIFHAHESFLTPRLPAAALALLGLERLLAGRRAAAGALIAAGGTLHPGMALGPAAATLAWTLPALAARPRRRLVAGVVAAAVATLGLLGGLGPRVAWTMDQEWLDAVRWATAHALGADWTAGDWIRSAVALALLAAAAGAAARHDAGAARMAWLLAGAGAAGVALTLAARALPLGLLVQAQPHRALWLASALQWPAALALAAALWSRERFWPRLGAVSILGWLAATRWTSGELAIVALLPLALAVLRLAGLVGESTARQRAALLGGLGAGLGLLTAIRLWYLLEVWPTRAAAAHPLVGAHAGAELLGATVWLPPALVLLPRLLASRAAPRAGALALAAGLVLHGGAFAVSRVPGLAPEGRIPPAVREAIRRSGGDRPPVVYSDWARPEELWLELGTPVFFHPDQAAAAIFDRALALESRRRAAVVAPFEVGRRAETLALVRPRAARGTVAAPAAPDLLRLCAERLDLLLLRRPVDPAGPGGAGPVDCRRLRPGDRPPGGVASDPVAPRP